MEAKARNVEQTVEQTFCPDSSTTYAVVQIGLISTGQRSFCPFPYSMCQKADTHRGHNSSIQKKQPPNLFEQPPIIPFSSDDELAEKC